MTAARRFRLAWFSPMPPVRSGVAACSAELVAALASTCDIDVFVDASRTPPLPGTRSAHDFLWLNGQRPYDLTVYQLGNSSVHDYQWAYAFRYPGLVVLHDTHLHHARAAALLRTNRPDDYRAEFAANHRADHVDQAELAIRGFDTHLYYHWPMRRLLIERSRLTAVHSCRIAQELRDESPSAAIEGIRLGHGVTIDRAAASAASARVRQKYAIPSDAIVFGVFGGLSPDKRLPQILAAVSALRGEIPNVRLLLAGAVPSHYDLRGDLERWRLADVTTLTGYVDSDEDLTEHIAAADVALTLRWPTAREVSGPWLRCLAAGKPTVITNLLQVTDVRSLDPRTWRVNGRESGLGLRQAQADPERSQRVGARDSGQSIDSHTAGPPVCIAIDILDEEHSLRLAMRRLAKDEALRAALGRTGQEYWRTHHDPALMIDDYRRIIPLACARPAPERPLPQHLLSDSSGTLDDVLAAFGVADPLR
jgi:glycosyltransferase involved in cell wall biosynthesis